MAIQPDHNVFYHAIRAGADPDEAERIALAVAQSKADSTWGKTKALVKKHYLKLVGAALTAGAAGLLNWLTGLIG